MSDPDLFDENNKQEKPPVTPAAPSSDPFNDKLNEITNEKGEPKYDSVEKALDALKASQDFIEQLKDEKRQVEEIARQREEDLAKMGSIEDFVNRVKPGTKTEETPATPGNSEGLSEEKVGTLFEQKLREREEATRAQGNLDRVISELSKQHGDQAAAHIKQRAQELDTTPAALKDLAQRNPTMALTLLGGSGGKVSTNPSLSSTSTSIPQNNGPERPTIERGKGAARGGKTDKELLALWKESANFTNKRLGVRE